MYRVSIFFGLLLLYAGALIGSAGMSSIWLSDRLHKVESRLDQVERNSSRTDEDKNLLRAAGLVGGGFLLFAWGFLLLVKIEPYERTSQPKP